MREKSVRSRMNDPRLLAYVAAAGAALGAAGSAEATVVYSGVQNKSIGQYITFASINNHDFTAFVNAFTTNSGAKMGEVQSFTGIDPVHFAGGFYAKNFSIGQAIGNVENFVATAYLFRHHNNSNIGNFTNSGYLGLEIKSGSNKYYGWAQIDNVNVSTPTFRVVDWAYQDAAGAQINAGEGRPSNAVPEPTSCALALIAMGAGGLAVHRRRRQEQQVSVE